MATQEEKIKIILDDSQVIKQIKAIENIKLTLKRIGISLDSLSVNKTLSEVEKRQINDKKFKIFADIIQAQKDLDKINLRKLSDKQIKVIAKLQDDLNNLSFKAKTLKVIPDTKEVRAELAKIEAVALTIKRLKLTVDSSTVSKSITDTNNQKVTDKKFKVFADILQAQKSLDSINRQKLSDKQIRVVTKLQDDLSNFSFKAKTFKVFADTKESKSEIARVEALKFAVKKIKFIIDDSTVGKSISDVDKRKILDKRFKIFAEIIQLQKDFDRLNRHKFSDKQIKVIAKLQNDLDKLVLKNKFFKIISDSKEARAELARLNSLKLNLKKILVSIDSGNVGKAFSDVNAKKLIDKRLAILVDIREAFKRLDEVDKRVLKSKKLDVVTNLIDESSKKKLANKPIKVEADIVDANKKLDIIEQRKLSKKTIDVGIKSTVDKGIKDIDAKTVKTKIVNFKTDKGNIDKTFSEIDNKNVKGKKVFIATDKGIYEKEFEKTNKKQYDKKIIKTEYQQPKEIKIPTPKSPAPVKIPVIPSQITPTDFFNLNKKEREEHKLTAQSKRQVDIAYMQAKIEDNNRIIASNRRLADEQKKVSFEQRRDTKISALPEPKRVTQLGSLDALKQQISYWKQIRGASDTASTSFKTADGHIQRLTASLKTASGQAKGLNIFQKLEVGENISSIALGLGGVAVAAGLVINTIKQMAAGIFQAVQQGSALNVLHDNFVKLSGGVELATEKLATLRQASAGNLNNQELELYANSMQLMGFAVDDSIKFLDLIERQSDQVSLSFEAGKEAIQSFITTGRLSGLKRLQLDIGAVDKEINKLITATGKKKIDLSFEELETVRATALLNLYGDSLENIGAKSLDQADKIASLVTGFQNAQESIKRFLADAAAPLIDGFIELRDEMTKQLAAVGITGDLFEDLKTNIISLVTSGVKFLVNVYKTELLPAYAQLAKAIKDFLSENPTFIESIKSIGKTFIDITVGITKFYVNTLSGLISKVSTVKKVFDTVIDVFVLLTTKLTFLKPIVSAVSAGFGFLADAFKAVYTLGQKIGVAISDIVKHLVRLADSFTGGTIRSAVSDFVSNTLHSIVDKLKEIRDWMDRVSGFKITEIITNFKNGLKNLKDDIEASPTTLKPFTVELPPKSGDIPPPKKDKPPTGSKGGADTVKEIEKATNRILELEKQIEGKLAEQIQFDVDSSAFQRVGLEIKALQKELAKLKSPALILSPVTDIAELQIQLADLVSLQDEFSDATSKTTVEWDNLQKKIRETENEIGSRLTSIIFKPKFEFDSKDLESLRDSVQAGLSAKSFVIDIDGKIKEIIQIEGFAPSKSQLEGLAGKVQGTEKQKTVAELRDELLSAFGEGIGSVQSMMDILGVGADTFITKLLSGFENIISLLQGFFSTVKAISEGTSLVKSIISIFTGGIFGGGGASPAGMPSPTGNSPQQQQQPNIVQFDNKSFERMLNSMQVTLQKVNPVTVIREIPMLAENTIRGNDIVTVYKRTNAKITERVLD